MLESLYRLVVPLVRAKDDKELSKGTLIRESKAAQKSAAERRREIDPIELEKELHLHYGRILCELDHIVDILSVTALKTKDDFEELRFGMKQNASIVPEFSYSEESRSFRLYWRRVTRVFASQSNTPGSIQSSRIPIRAGDDKDERAGYYPKSVFAGQEPNDRKLLGDTEDKFKELRFLMHQVNAMRRTIETADRHATKFFDETIIYDTQPRIKKSKMDNVPSVEEPTIIKVPETAQ